MVCLCSLPWSGSKPNREFLRPKRMLNVLPAEVVPLGYETCMKLMWQLMGTKSIQLSGWGRTPACLKDGHTLFLNSRENWKKTGWKCRTEEFLDDKVQHQLTKTSCHRMCVMLPADSCWCAGEYSPACCRRFAWTRTAAWLQLGRSERSAGCSSEQRGCHLLKMPPKSVATIHLVEKD